MIPGTPINLRRGRKYARNAVACGIQSGFFMAKAIRYTKNGIAGRDGVPAAQPGAAAV